MQFLDFVFSRLIELCYLRLLSSFCLLVCQSNGVSLEVLMANWNFG